MGSARSNCIVLNRNLLLAKFLASLPSWIFLWKIAQITRLSDICGRKFENKLFSNLHRKHLQMNLVNITLDSILLSTKNLSQTINLYLWYECALSQSFPNKYFWRDHVIEDHLVSGLDSLMLSNQKGPKTKLEDYFIYICYLFIECCKNAYFDLTSHYMST